ncbi:MAG: ABC transporter substrate-binding protein [Spirochaetaceae bacterium]|nr:ABC transporter substrate-binding protein [Spirochaetaceae bacterium]MDT8296694.1 ABC transporter substrate-binding protein [Spirochaetaceae bacterium]
MKNRSTITPTAVLALLAIFAVLPLSARGTEDVTGEVSVAVQAPTTIRFVTPGGFSAITLAEFIAESPEFDGNVRVEYEVLESSDLLAGRILSGQADMFIAPTNLGSTLYAKGEDIVMAGSVIWGILYLVTTEGLSDWEDLRGREIFLFGRGLTPDIVFRYLLETHGLNPGSDITLSYIQNTAELGPALIAGRAPIAMLPEPVLSVVLTKAPDAEIMIDIQKEWAAASGTGSSYPQASLFVQRSVAREHPEFLSSFLARYQASIQRIVADPDKAGEWAASFLPSPPAPIIARSIPGGNLKWVSARNARSDVEEYLEVLMGYDPKTIGGSLPDDGFYLSSP